MVRRLCKQVAWGTWGQSSEAAGKSAQDGLGRKFYRCESAQAFCQEPAPILRALLTWKDEKKVSQ
jgi:hypothetical protein